MCHAPPDSFLSFLPFYFSRNVLYSTVTESENSFEKSLYGEMNPIIAGGLLFYANKTLVSV